MTIGFRDPAAKNTHGDTPKVSRVDFIVGEVRGTSEDPNLDRNGYTRVVSRFTDKQWSRDGDVYTITTSVQRVERALYSGPRNKYWGSRTRNGHAR